MKNIFKKLTLILKDRLFMLFSAIGCMFLILIFKFYTLQIINYNQYRDDLRASIQRQIEIPAIRGHIFDRYGRPLAANQSVNVLKFDQQVKMKKEDMNKVLLEVIRVLEKNGESYIDHLPITKQAPFEYTGSKNEINSFAYDLPYNNEEHRQELLTYTSEEIIAYLRKKFAIDTTFSEEEARQILSLRIEIYKSSYAQYKLVNLATQISDQTMNEIEENQDKYPGVIADVDPIRYYPEGEVMGNILGYVRTITNDQFNEMQALGYSYQKDDVIGQMGIEESMEETLRGEKGKETVEVDNVGRRVHTIATEESVQGNDIFLTLDLDLQKDTYESVEKHLSEALVVRLQGGSKTIKPISSKEVVKSMVESNQLLLDKMEKAKNDSIQKKIYTKLLLAYNQIDPLIRKNLSLKQLLLQWIEEDIMVTEKELLLAMHEQGTIKLDKATLELVKNNIKGTTEDILIKQLKNGTLKPKQFAIDPFSAAAAVVDVNTGEVLSLVGYPSFDSNQMSIDFNAYYLGVTDGFDKRSTLVNRALRTAKAPGSTFKMLTGIAGLEEGVITPSTKVVDTGTFTKAGAPYPRCWVLTSSGGGHGVVNLNRALEVSCNYYFYEVAYRLGKESGNPYANIDVLTRYVSMFGLDKKTGIELQEVEPNISTPKNLLTQQIKKVIKGFQTKDSVFLNKRMGTVQESLKKGVYPVISLEKNDIEDINQEIEYLIQGDLKRYLEPLLQQALKAHYAALLEQIYKEIGDELQIMGEEVVHNVVQNTLGDLSNQVLKVKTEKYLKQELELMVSSKVDEEIGRIIGQIDNEDLIDAYDQAYTLTYRSEIRKKDNQKLTEELIRLQKELDTQAAHYKKAIVIKIRQNIINTIANDLLDGVELEWTDGLTIRTAIGQANNAFSPLQIARYIAGIANCKQTYALKIVQGIYDNKVQKQYKATAIEKATDIEVKESTMKEIHKGMLAVTTGGQGTARENFKQLPFTIGAKTGTAEDGSHEHGWFVGFAPYDKPQVAVVVTLYNADGLGNYSQLIAKDMIESYFKLDLKHQKTTLDNIFVE